jgi:WD40 repeat protein
VLGVAFSPDGERLASAGGGDNTVNVWDWRGDPKEPVKVLKATQNIIRNPVFSPDGRRLVAVAAIPATIWSWDATTGEGKGRPLPGASKVSQAVFRPDGRLAVVSSGRVQFLAADAPDGPDLVGGHAGEIGCAAFSPDGRFLATGAGYKGRGEIRIWGVARWEKMR